MRQLYGLAGSIAPETPTGAVIAKRLRKADSGVIARSALNRVVVAALVLVAVFAFAFGFYVVPDQGMEKALQEGDVVLFYRLESSYTSGDVVVYEADGEVRIGRIVAMPSESVEITTRGEFKVNGNVQSIEGGAYVMPAEDGVTYPYLLNLSSYFVLGDNYEAAYDSREVGAVSQDEILGKAITVLRRRSI